MSLLNNGQYNSNSQSWLGAVDVGYLTEEERDAILSVLWRDEKIRKTEQVRISKLKTELRDVKRKGAKNAETSYANRVCARCNSKMGIIINASTQCPVCKHKVCQQCRASGFFSQNWKCIVCYKEAQLKAETGEWFYGMMRPELRSMQDGSSLVKQAVTTKSIHFDQRSSSDNSQSTAPAIMCTPASSNSHEESPHGRKDFVSVSSADTEGTGSSTESRKHRHQRGRTGPAETGSIQSLRARSSSGRQTASDRSCSPNPAPPPRSRNSPSPEKRPSKPPRILDVATKATKSKKKKAATDEDYYKQQQNAFYQEVNTEPQMRLPLHVLEKKSSIDSDVGPDYGMSDQASVSSADSKSIDIDGAVAEYIQSQQDSEKGEQAGNGHHNGSYRSYQDDLYADERHRVVEQEQYFEERKDHVSQLPPHSQSTLPRRLNEKLLQQNNLSASVPTVYPNNNNKKTTVSAMNSLVSDDNTSMDYSMSMNRELSTSVPNLMKSSSSSYSASMQDLSITGEIRFSLKFIYKTNILLVNIVDCRNLATADRKRKRSDPYVKCYLLPDRKNKQKTDVKKRSTYPTYNKCLKFSVSHSELSTRILELSVWHAGTFTRNLFLGQVQVPLDTWDWETSNENWFPLRQRETISADFVRGTIYKGDLIVGLRYVPPGALSPGKRKAAHGELNVLIKQAKNLTPVRSNGTADACVKIMLQPNKQFRQKTSVIPKTSSPEWNSNIRMQLYQPMEDCGLQLSIWHRDKLQGSTFLGGCRLNLGHAVEKWMDASGMEVGLWQTAINSPNTWVDGSLSLRPNM